MSEADNSSKKPRIYHLDLIRGVAVLLMIAAHAVDFYHDGSLTYLRFFVNSINAIAFSTFLILSGAVAYIAYLQHPQDASAKKRILRRLVLFLASYYLLAVISLSDKIIALPLANRWQTILDILIFKTVPSYSEFLIPFFIYSLLVFPLRSIFLKLSSSWRITVIAGALIYALGFFLSFLPCPAAFIPWKAIFVGHGDIYRFPLIHYFPLYLLGLWWGKWLLENSHLHYRRLLSLKIFSAAIALVFISGLIYLLYRQNLSQTFDRWPPTIPFLLLGIIFLFALSYFLFQRHELRSHPFFRDTLLLMGQNAFALYWTHIFLLKLYRFSGGAEVSSLFIVFGLFLVLTITSLALATFIPFNFSFHLTFIRENLGRPFLHYHQAMMPPIYNLAEDVQHRPRLLHRSAFFIFAGVVFVLTLSLAGYPNIQISARKPPPPTWWNKDYAYRRPLEIKNLQPFTALSKDSAVLLTFNHRQLTQESKALPDGLDLKIVTQDGRRFQEVPGSLNNLNSETSTIAFPLIKDIPAGQKSNDYYLYYGNPIAKKDNLSKKITLASPEKFSLSVNEEEAYPIVLTGSRRWILKPDALFLTEQLTLTAHISPQNQDQTSLVSYEVIGTSLRGNMNPVSNEAWEATIDAATLPPGTYRARAKLTKGSDTKFSQNSGFYVSYPLYTTWTYDWEGYDVSDAYLQAMDQLTAKHHNIPLTHFFSPRIYTAPNISPARQQYLTDWVKNRRAKHGEEINLHLHMFPDYVQKAGLTPKLEPRWGYDADGYDILTTAYNSEEILTLINYAKQIFEAKGLGVPEIYRAGGWYANLDTLKAVADAGLKADSSGRTQYKFGSRQQSGPWNLTPTSKPYYPSLSNQNSSQPSPNLSILEIPDNGADSYAFSASQMIDRFRQNYSEEPLNEKQQITFLTHPHWFGKAEQKKVDDLFTFVDQYIYDLDQGPVRYVTSNQVYEIFSGEAR